MNSIRDGIPLAGFLTFMNIWVTLFCGPQLWHAWASVPWARVGLLLLAGGMSSTLMNVWSLILHAPVSNQTQPLSTSAIMEGADV